MPKIRIKSLPKANNGLMIEDNQFKSLSPNFIELGGQSHANGGTDISYFGEQVEAERGEPVAITNDGAAVVFGKLKVPGMGSKTFKTVAKEIAKDENKNSKLLDKSMELVNSNNPHNKFQKYSFNSGMVMGQYASGRQAQLTAEKEQLAGLQDLMLSVVENDKNAKWGKKMKYDGGGDIGPGDGKGSVAQRHNNPGNIKYAKWLEKYGATRGQAATDGGYFASFPSIQQGQSAMIELLDKPMYRNKTVKDAIRTWTGGEGYKNIPMEIRNTQVGKLDRTGKRKLLDTITFGEDSKKYNWEGTTQNNTTGYTLPEVEVTAPRLNSIPLPDEKLPLTPLPFNSIPQPGTTIPSSKPVKPLGNLDIPNKRRLPSLADQNKLSFGQIAPELLMLATERRQFVPGQRYEPQLYTPYQVSFQDQLNQNQSTFSDVSRRVGNNASALGALAAQKYTADSQVMANEFRTNQEISTQTTNQNTSLLNQAQLTNLELQDRQFVRQTQAAANTRSNVLGAVNSLSAKYQQNRAENNTIRLYENMFNYRPDENLQLIYMGEDPVFSGGTPSATSQNQASRSVYDKNGNLMRTTIMTPSQLKTAQDQQKVEQQRRKNLFNFF